MVDVVQSVEHRIVVPSVVGSSPIIHPGESLFKRLSFLLVVTVEGVFVGLAVDGALVVLLQAVGLKGDGT